MNAAVKLEPDLAESVAIPPLERAKLRSTPRPKERWLPRWVRWSGDDWEDEDDGRYGQGLAEYALILALVAIIAIVALLFLGGQVSGILSAIGDSI